MKYTGNENVDSRATYYQKRNEYIINNNMQPELILFGDSITEGFNPNSYGIPSKTYINCGIGGERIQTGYQRVERDIISLKPKQVHIMLGINDLLHFPQVDIDKIDERVQELINKYQKIVNEILGKNIQVWCGSILKLAEIEYDEKTNVFINYMYYNEIITRLNRRIKGFCIEKDIKFIDYNVALTNEYNQLNVTYSYDGIHLNEKGYFEIFKVMKSEGVL